MPMDLLWSVVQGRSDALGLNLLADPWRFERESAVAWQTGLWYWMTQNGPAHDDRAQRDGQRRRHRPAHPQHQGLY